ncbi:MAG: carbohydrate ABC transporter permease [Candidatus Sumerlaeota bacterium]|nr:carbohydrate ABC transporter permease [Candidatus Sumerlaeota bacterium]
MANKEATEGRSLLSNSDLKHPWVRFIYWIVFVSLVLGVLTAFLPLLWGVMNALKSPRDIFAFPPRILPQPVSNPLKWEWGNYATAWRRVNFPKYFLNTIILALGVWFFNIFPSALAGYAISKFRSRLSRAMAFLFFMTLMVPFEAIMIPLYLTVKDLPFLGINLLQDRWGGGMMAVILPAGANAFNIFVFKGFFDDIPRDLMEAARIDGAGEWQIFLVIVVPLSRSIIAVLSIFSIMGTWNDFFWPMIVIHNEKFHPIMLKLYNFSLSPVSESVVLASLILATIPPIILFLIFQRQIMRGIALSGLKY